MKSSVCVSGGKQNGFLRIVSSIVTITSLWLMLAAAPISTLAQSQASPADWTQLHRDNMQRWNPYETELGINNVAGLHLKWINPVGLYESTLLSAPAVVNGVAYFGSDAVTCMR